MISLSLSSLSLSLSLSLFLPPRPSQGFAFVHFMNKKDAKKAIDTLNGYGYDHLILKVEWAK